ncbi:TniB family NTP-binding protein [Collimonas pratensis]|nr:TniB family NTP-binding protein [Collimonas pratensis]
MTKNHMTLVQQMKNPIANPAHARIATLDAVVVAHNALKTALEGIEQCISWSAVSKEPRGAVLVGVGGTGKTTICNTILKKFPPHDIVEPHAMIRMVPAFFASVPSPSTIKSLATNLLEQLGDPSPNRGNATSLTDRLCKLIKLCRTKIIILDEFHHLLAESSVGEARTIKICNWLKTLINETGVMVCLVGLPACEALVNHDSQMSRRFTHRFRLKELSIGTSSAPGPLQGFLLALSKEFVARLNLDGFVDFKEHLHVLQMWAATSGNPAFVSLLLKEATSIALSAGRNTMVVSDLDEAFSRGITLSVARTSTNPFTMSRQMLISHADK